MRKMPEAQYLKSGSSGKQSQSWESGSDLSLLDDTEHITLCEALDRILNKGAVVVGELTISVANIDLVYLGLQLILTSIETAREAMTMKDDEAQGDNR